MAKSDGRRTPGERLSREGRKAGIEAVQAWFLDERGEEIGELGAGFLLEAALEATGAEIYNLGVADAAAAVRTHYEIVESDLAALILDTPRVPEGGEPPYHRT